MVNNKFKLIIRKRMYRKYQVINISSIDRKLLQLLKFLNHLTLLPPVSPSIYTQRNVQYLCLLAIIQDTNATAHDVFCYSHPFIIPFCIKRLKLHTFNAIESCCQNVYLLSPLVRSFTIVLLVSSKLVLFPRAQSSNSYLQFVFIVILVVFFFRRFPSDYVLNIFD